MDKKDSLNEIKRNIDHDPSRMIWAQQFFDYSDMRHMRHMRHYHQNNYPPYLRENLSQITAERIFELIQDGRKYTIQAEWFENLPPENVPPDDFDFLYTGPKFSVGYKGYIAEVETIRRREFEFMPPVTLTMLPTYRAPTWRELRQGLTSRFKESFTVPNIAKIFYKQVVARILYLPDVNPHHWGF